MIINELMKVKVFWLICFALVAIQVHAKQKHVFEIAQSFAEKDVDKMMQGIRRDGNDGKTWLLAYGDSITDGFGASDMLKTGYVNLLREGLKLVDQSFDVVQNSAGYRCVGKNC